MKTGETLTKENFWDELYAKYPTACQVFCDWIDKYKARPEIDWVELFANNVKFHTIPYEMQMGIWIAFVNDQLEFEEWQIEFPYFDLRTSITSYMAAREPRKVDPYNPDDDLPF